MTDWNRVAENERPSWYLDPLVARQKQQAHLELIRRWAPEVAGRRVLKTDLFEEAYGDDQLLFELAAAGAKAIGFDVSFGTVRRAFGRSAGESRLLVADVRRLSLAPDSVDVIISNSTLDHFETADEFDAALRELCRVLRPGGVLIVTLDNPRNLLYHPLRWLSRRRASPFPLGYTVSRARLAEALTKLVMEVHGTDTLIHNPRLVSTAVFLALRSMLGRHADWPIARLLAVFAALGALPTREWTACFIAVAARKVEAEPSV